MPTETGGTTPSQRALVLTCSLRFPLLVQARWTKLSETAPVLAFSVVLASATFALAVRLGNKHQWPQVLCWL